MADLLVDTDVLIDHLRGARGFEVPPEMCSYSVITRAELFSGRRLNEPAVKELLDSMEEIPVDRAIAERAGLLRRARLVPMPDALIAATALARSLRLLTRNLKDYAGIKGLKIVSPR